MTSTSHLSLDFRIKIDSYVWYLKRDDLLLKGSRSGHE